MRLTKRSAGERGAVHLGVVLAVLGLLAGGAGSGFVVQRTVFSEAQGEPVGVTGRQAVPVFVCPGAPPSGSLHSGDRVFATAVHDDLAGWLRIRHPLDAGRELWIEGRFVVADASTDALPKAPCQQGSAAGPDTPTTTTTSLSTTTTEGRTTTTRSGGDDDGTGSPSGGGGGQPGTTTTTKAGSQSTTTTSDTGSSPDPTTTTTAGDTSDPSIGTISASPGDMYEQGCSPSTSTVSVDVSDTGTGVASVTIKAEVNGKVNSGTATLSGGSWRRTVGPFPAGTVSGTEDDVTLTVTATDGAGNTATKVNTTALDLVYCLT